MNTQKGFISALLILVGLVLIGGGVYFYKTKSGLNNEEPVRENEIQNASSTNTVVKENIQDKATFNSQEEQTKTREKTNGVYDYKEEKGILFVLEKEYPNPDKYKLPITVSGYLSENGKWRMFEGEAGVVEIYAFVNGVEKKIASSPMSVNTEGYFDLTVGDRQWMSSLDNQSGYVLIKEAGAKDTDSIDSVKVPIVFDIQ